MKMIYDPMLDERGWFSHLLTPSGWLDQELIDSGEVPPVVANPLVIATAYFGARNLLVTSQSTQTTGWSE